MVLLFSVIVLLNCPISNIPWSQDFTGVPAVVDLACMRDAMNKLGSDSNKINPLVYFYFLNTFILSVCGERWICGVWTSWFNSLLWPMVSHIMLIAKTWEIWWDVSCWYLIIMKNCNIWTLLLFYSWLWSSFMIFFNAQRDYMLQLWYPFFELSILLLQFTSVMQVSVDILKYPKLWRLCFFW